MATTFAIELGKRMQDGSRAVYIKITHNRVYKREKMPFIASPNDLNKKGMLTNNLLLGEVEKRIALLRERLITLGFCATNMNVHELYKCLTDGYDVRGGNESEEFHLDFFQYGYGVVEKMKKDGRKSSAASYNSALNSLKRFLNSEHIDINSIDKAMLLRYKEWFFSDGEDRSRAFELYMGCLQKLHNMAKEEYNDEDDERELIHRSPFKHVTFKVTRFEKSKIVKKALSVDAIRLIAELPDKTYDVTTSHYLSGKGSPICNMARDMFLLSFGLCGMNAVDMWGITKLTNGKVAYYRAKTFGRSGEDSYTEVSIPSEMEVISERNRGRKGYWAIRDRYVDNGTLNAALNNGLKDMVRWMEQHYGKSAEELGIPENFSFYSARHSWATIARNECGVPTDVVDRCLCHVTGSIADRSYIKRDYSFVDEANRKVMELVFGK